MGTIDSVLRNAYVSLPRLLKREIGLAEHDVGHRFMKFTDEDPSSVADGMCLLGIDDVAGPREAPSSGVQREQSIPWESENFVTKSLPGRTIKSSAVVTMNSTASHLSDKRRPLAVRRRARSNLEQTLPLQERQPGQFRAASALANRVRCSSNPSRIASGAAFNVRVTNASSSSRRGRFFERIERCCRIVETNNSRLTS